MNYDFRPRIHIDALIFSLNDVLVDVSYSHHQVVRKTVQIYLERALGLPKSSQMLVTPEEVIYLQRVAGITNYWDLARGFIGYFVSLLPAVPVVTFPIRFHVPAIMAYLQTASARLQADFETLKAQKDIKKLAQQIAKAGGGLDGLYKILPNTNRHLVVATGEITRINLVGRIYQECYLGANLFEKVYQQPAVVIQSTGYMEHETLLIDPTVLEQLHEKIPLGVVSTRPQHEVEHSLRIRQITPYFQSIVTYDDIQKSRAQGIPNPWILLEAARRLQPTPTQVGYIGATLADVQATRQANNTIPFTAIACLAGSSKADRVDIRTIFENNGASIILGHPDNLKEHVLD